MVEDSEKKDEQSIEKAEETLADASADKSAAEDELEEAVAGSGPARTVKRSRMLIRVVILIVVAALLVVGAILIRRHVMTPITDPVGTVVSTSGKVSLYMHDDLVTDSIKVPLTLYEGHRVETGEGATAVLLGGLPVSDPVRSATIHLRENSRIMCAIPPTIQIEKGTIAVRVPGGCMGFSVDLRDTEERDLVRCGSMQGDFVVTREGKELHVEAYSGEVRISNVTDGADVLAGHRSSMELGGIPTEPEEMEDTTAPKEFTQ